MPVLVGWAAVAGELSIESAILFAIIFYWTPPHSWALALLVNVDYSRAGVPMMPVARGERVTHIQILLYSIQLVLITILPTPLQMLGIIYLLAALALGGGLLWMSIRLLRVADRAVARSLYKYSTAYLAFLFLAMILDQTLLGS
jgi:protoheme IX farnesyltransferase